MFRQTIEYIDASEVVLPPPVKKQVWDGEKFVPMTLYKTKGCPSIKALEWLATNIGHAGTYQNGSYWDFSRAGDFTVMDEKVYMWYTLKWGNK